MVDIFKRTDLGVVPFGRFKGMKWSALNEDYLRYLISDECNTSTENKCLARRELDQRIAIDGQIRMF